MLRARGASGDDLRAVLAYLNRRLCDPPLVDDEVARIADSIARYEPQTRPDDPAAHREFERLDEGRYVLRLPGIMSELEVDRLRRSSGELLGELTVRCWLPGARGVDGVVSIADWNLSSARARIDRAKLVAARAGGKDIDWQGIVEDPAQRVILAERAGEPAVDLADVPARQEEPFFYVDGMALPKQHPLILFGDGGACKSYLALHLALRLVERGETILYADWELDEFEHRERLQRLAGAPARGIKYARCRLPLVDEAERLRRQAHELEASYLVWDSVALGCDGPSESAEVAMRYFQALRRIGLGSLLIAHVTKNEEGDKRPFGSAFWHNSARSTWNAKRSEQVGDESTVQVALFNRKANLGPLRQPLGFEVVFEPDRTIVRRTEAADVPEFAKKMSVAQRMARALRRGPLTVAVLMEQIDVSDDSIRQALRRNKGRFLRLPDGRIALLERAAGGRETVQ